MESFPPAPVIFIGLVSLGTLIWQMVSRSSLNNSIKQLINKLSLAKSEFGKGRKKYDIKLINDFSNKKSKFILIAIILFAFVTRVYQIQNPPKDYFDEIYHAFTARLVLHADSKAWEWWNPHPEGFAYEWTHPPVSKLGMALGMVFGENSFGWRIPQAIVGTISILFVYCLPRNI
jgi:dolichyl-phosphate-mannose--protein O-mannosyl transferase